MSQQRTPHLSLWKKHLGSVPDSIWQQTQLETLILADNDLTELSAEIGHLKKLRMLDLGHNRLTQLPDALGDLDSLTDFLYLHDNRLSAQPPSLDRLKKLRFTLLVPCLAFPKWNGTAQAASTGTTYHLTNHKSMP